AAPALRVPRERRARGSTQGDPAQAGAAAAEPVRRVPVEVRAAAGQAQDGRRHPPRARRLIPMPADAALYLGLISGTSADGIDAALVRFEPALEVLATATTAYPGGLRDEVLALTRADAAIPLDSLGRLDTALGACFADAALDLLRQAAIAPAEVRAIGSHGQTVRHRPDGALPFTLQLGDPSVIAERTGIATIADFRRADVAAGGQGAPLAPAFHAAVLGCDD